MSFTDEALKAKLSTLNETQDSIVSVSQWIMFHKRHADRIASYWLTRLRDAPPPKRLNFIYLVNDIVQNARARKRAEFPDAFAALMPEAIQTAYRSSPPEIQTKIRRVVEVWRNRNVFETPILEAIEARTDEVDKSKGSSGKKTLMGQSLFTSTSSTGMPKEIESLAPLQIAVTKETISARPAIDTAQAEYIKLNDPAAALPSPPVHAARLSSLIKSLAAAESSVSASIKARKALVADLERILEINKAALAKDEQTYLELDSRKTSTDAKKREVEDAIIRGLSSVEGPADTTLPGISAIGDDILSPGLDHSAAAGDGGFGRPEIEELTPERDLDGDEQGFMGYNPSEPLAATPTHQAPIPNNPAVAAVLAGFGSPSAPQPSDYSPTQGISGYGSNVSRVRSFSGSGGGINGLSAKRRKLSHGEDEMVPDLGEMGMEGFGQASSFAVGDYGGGGSNSHGDFLQSLDEDVDELLRQEGGGR
ncbi:hypothetical protein LTR84_012450 [Exophiala bonariae]|uniref:CID domain-containing protein n=1 Tax=Exophiala bonariae TaxID=1690606 RepID=A0AAV9NE31_9EURO|nr:hypothetical protein LTR84_012450 [Exophiala bonariae]